MCRIMVVDDLRDNADSLALLFEVLGHTARTSYDGREALDIARSFAPDVVLLDLDMPVLDGYAAATALRRLLAQTAPVLIALSALPQPDQRLRDRDGGFDFYLTKPADFGCLFAIVDARDRLGATTQ